MPAAPHLFLFFLTPRKRTVRSSYRTAIRAGLWNRYGQPAQAYFEVVRRLARHREGIDARRSLPNKIYRRGLDHRAMDPQASLGSGCAIPRQFAQHLGTDHVDSCSTGIRSRLVRRRCSLGDDAEERDAGRTRLIGVSNVSLKHLVQLDQFTPASVIRQNVGARCLDGIARFDHFAANADRVTGFSLPMTVLQLSSLAISRRF